MFQRLVITGGRPLSGTLRPAGNKNAALPIIAATLLAGGPVTLRNVPRIGDVATMLELVQSTGAGVRDLGGGAVRIAPSGLRSADLDPALCARIRGSVLLAAPLLARLGAVVLPAAGGDVIGRRRLDTHLLALCALGAEAGTGRDLELCRGRFQGGSLLLDEASVTGTENAVMAAVTAAGATRIANAACEPHVQDLCRFLVALGARIEGIGSNHLCVTGVDELSGGEYTVQPDHVEVASFIGCAAVTGGELNIEGVEPEHLRPIEIAFNRLGV